MPTLTTSTPAARSPSDSAWISSGPESRPSRATTTASPPCARTSLPNARPMERAVSASSVLPITPRMSYALNMDCEIMDWLTYVQWKFDRHGVVTALCLAGSGPDTTYNCAFQRRLTSAILMLRRPALTKLPHRFLGRARQSTDATHLPCPRTTGCHHADTGA